MIRLEFIRHGETELGGGLRGSLDDALTLVGWEQLRSALATGSCWDRLVSSPLQRCARFAEELAAQHNLPLELEPRLQELHFGEWEGRTAAQLMDSDAQALGQFWADPYTYTPPAGERLEAFEARVFAALDALLNRYAGQHVLIVSHGGVMRLLLARARGLPRSDLLQVTVGYAQRVVFDYCSDGSLKELQ